ncbi:MAG: 50S ribosome-binding GTPase [Prolixibacteraceae bacterium]|nr:50S ribosome-binding GTPase [Prolixibacteraceae bacterium]
MLTEREHIGIFGKMNSGKSSLMNLLTQQETSITDSTPGTTADVKIALQEIHGLGPVKFFDTAGLDEGTLLGAKKREKVMNVLKECDLVLLVIDPSTKVFDSENQIIEAARELDKQILVIYNLFEIAGNRLPDEIETQIPLLKFIPSITLSAIDVSFRQSLLNFILNNYDPKFQKTDLLPFVEKDQFYILNIPMDEETPPGRYLRPQAMAEEYITRNWAFPISYRMNLGVARSENPQPEKDRFDAFLNSLGRRPKALITDSQAMDIMAKWTPPDIMLTTFSIMMINFMSKGRIYEFYEGIKALDKLQPGDKVLIAEACNHSRINEDIGTVQIPRKINQTFPGVIIDHNFGREFQTNSELGNYKLIIHCGGCMISHQKLQARLRDLRHAGVPVTNYGVFLSWMQGQAALERVMEPWRKD